MATVVDAKRARTIAKGLFTRACSNFYRNVNEKEIIEIVESRFLRVQKEYFNTQENHEQYMTLVGEDAYEENNKWVEEVDIEFDQIEKVKIEYVGRPEKSDVKDRTSLITSNQQRIFSLRMIEESIFNHQVEVCMRIIYEQAKATDPLIEIIKDAQSDLKRQLNICGEANQKYIMTIDNITDSEINWINLLYGKVCEIDLEVAKLSKDIERNVKRHSNHLRLEPIKRPTFDGNIRHYARFKKDFINQVLSEVNDDKNSPYVLKSCLYKTLLQIIRNVDDDLASMWARQDEKNGKASKFTDAVMNETKRFRPI